MSRKEAYDYKRHNFIKNTLKDFDFLVLEYGYTNPVQEKVEQENGVIISDTFKFTNREKDCLIIISNQYHPYDYGFSINICKFSNCEESEMLYYKLKENQDPEQSYTKEAAQFLKKYLKKGEP